MKLWTVNGVLGDYACLAGVTGTGVPPNSKNCVAYSRRDSVAAPCQEATPMPSTRRRYVTSQTNRAEPALHQHCCLRCW